MASRVADIFAAYSKYKIERTAGGTPIAVFRGPSLPAVVGNGGTGNAGLITHDVASLERFMMLAELAGGLPETAAPWQRALAELRGPKL